MHVLDVLNRRPRDVTYSLSVQSPLGFTTRPYCSFGDLGSVLCRALVDATSLPVTEPGGLDTRPLAVPEDPVTRTVTPSVSNDT